MKKKKQTKKLSETELINSIKDFCLYAKIFAYQVRTTGIYDPTIKQFRLNKRQTKGIPDITIVYKGYHIGVETKVNYNKQTEEQKEFEKKLKQAGGYYFICYSLPEFESKLKLIQREIDEKTASKVR